MIKVLVDKNLSGVCPSILDLTHSLENISLIETIEIRWENSRQEKIALDRNSNRNFTLYVPDRQASERAIATLELSLTMDSSMLGAARMALSNKKLYNWRDFSKENGVSVTKHLVLKLAADEIRKGNKPKLALVVKDVFLEGITPSNADTLLRLRILRGY